MQHHEGTFSGAGGEPLYYQSWHPSNPGQGVVTIMHGLGGHCGAFNRVVQSLLSHDYIVYGFDLRGHGRSPGQRGYLNRWSDFREDLHAFQTFIQTQEPTLPRFLLGHSLGALLCLDYSLHYPAHLSGVIALAPALKQVGVSPIRVVLGQILSWIYPRFSLNTGIDPNTASRDPAILQTYATDPLRHSRGTARLATEFVATTTWVWQHAAEFQVPLLLMHGEADGVTCATASDQFFQQIPFADKKWVLYPGSYHHLYDDLNAEEVLMDIHHWLEQHVSRPAPTQAMYPLDR
jgi:alpha-beta hydrolase superfamily lysophospholipase